MEWNIKSNKDGKKSIINIDLGFFEYHTKYDADDNYVVHWEIDWFWMLVVAWVGYWSYVTIVG